MLTGPVDVLRMRAGQERTLRRGMMHARELSTQLTFRLDLVPFFGT